MFFVVLEVIELPQDAQNSHKIITIKIFVLSAAII